MKKFSFVLFLTCLVALVGCKPDEPKVPNTNNNGNNNPTETVSMQQAYLSGVVKTADNKPLAGVTVKTGSATATTDANGHFAFTSVNVVESRYVVSFQKAGYFNVSRSGEKAQSTTMDVVMHARGNSEISSRSRFDVSKGAKLSAGKMKVNIGTNALKKADGSIFSGEVNADVLYLSPENEAFSSMMPGSDMAAVRNDESDATLLSFGMVEVSLTDDSGNSLQLNEGEEAEMTFPIPENMKNNPPATIPLWYYDDATGLWVEEGTATLKDGVYVGNVKHFSWHNLDVPAERVTIKGVVVDCEKRPVAGVKVVADQTYAYTDASGNYSVYVPDNTPVTVTVPSSEYFNYSPVVSHRVAGQPGGTVVTQNFELPCLPVVTGQVLNSCAVDELAFANVYLEYIVNGETFTTTPVWTAANGNFLVRMPSAATHFVLHINTAEGKKLNREFDREAGMSNHDAGIFEICESVAHEYLRMILNDGTAHNVQFVWNEKMVVGVVGSILTITNETYASNGEIFVLSVAAFDPKLSTWTATIGCYSGVGVFSGENVQLECVGRQDGMMQLAVSGTLEYTNVNLGSSGVGEQSAATVSGVITIPEFASGNVAAWSEIKHLPASVPELPTPITNVDQVSTSGHFLTTLSYATFAENSVETLCNTLKNGGFVQQTDQNSESDTTQTFSFMSENAFVSLTYNATASDYQLVVNIAENIGGGNQGGDNVTVRCWEVSYKMDGITTTENVWGTEAEIRSGIAAIEQYGGTVSYRATDKTQAECEASNDVVE